VTPRFGLLSVPLLLTLAASAQESIGSIGTVRKDPQALAVISKASAAMGMGNAAATQDSVAHATVTYGRDVPVAVTITTKAKDRLRYDLPDGRSTFVSQGEGTLVTKGERHSLPLWTTKYQRPEHIPALSMLGTYTDTQLNVVYVGQESVAGRLCHHIEIFAAPSDGTPPDTERLLSEYHAWIDAETFVLAKTRTYMFSTKIIENRSAVENTFNDYRLVSGMLIPFRITHFSNGSQLSETVLTDITFNVGVADSAFE
jgi:outer membrane lipoprotein-sorting protein